MKKLLLIICAVGISAVGFAQAQSGLTYRKSEEVKMETLKDLKGNKTEQNSWYDWSAEVASVSAGSGYFTTLFPDTTIKFEYTSTGYGPVNWHALGQVFDPKGSLWFSQTIKLDSNDEYMVDSIAIPYRYFRYQTSKPDTLKIQIYKNDKLQDLMFTSSGNRFKTTDYDYLTNKGVSFTSEIVEILDDNDTAAAAKFMVLPLNISVDRGEVMAVTFNYIPGHPYSPGDTIYSTSHNVGYKLNRFDQYFYADPGQLFANGYYNSALMIDAGVRTNSSSNGWDGLYIPGIAYTDHITMMTQFHVFAEEVGVEDVKNNGFAVNQNTPNPFSGVTSINYSLETPTNVNLVVYDITGKSVATINEGFKNTGSYKLELNGSSLQNGVYYYSFRTDYGQVTKKMMIQH